MFCEKCGAENPDDGTYCQKCGASLTEGSAPKAKSEAKSKPKSRSKRSTASSKTEPKTTTKTGGYPDMIKGLPIQMILVVAGVAALAIALLSGILAAAGAGDHVDGAYKASLFFDHFIDGIMVAGILAGFAFLVGNKE